MDSPRASTPAHEASQWRLGARSETGYVRTANEDRMGWVRTAFGDVYVISDGMGGYRGGALAAELTVSTLQQSLSRASPKNGDFAEQVRQAFTAANEAVYQRRDPNDPNTKDMGATAVVLITNGSSYMVGHVGDSRAYLWRRFMGLKRLTKDHTRLQGLVDKGVVKEADAAQHPDAGLLVRAIGHAPTVEVQVSRWRRVRAGDMLLLCSDGLSGYVSDREIGAALRTGKSPRRITDGLIQKALAKGGEDNVTVQLLRYGPQGYAHMTPATVVASAAALMVLGLAGLVVQQRAELRAVQAKVTALEKARAPGQQAARKQREAVNGKSHQRAASSSNSSTSTSGTSRSSPNSSSQNISSGNPVGRDASSRNASGGNSAGQSASSRNVPSGNSADQGPSSQDALRRKPLEP